MNFIVIITLLSLLSYSSSFSFNVTSKKQCDTFELNWSGAKQGSVSFVAIPNGNPPDEDKPDRVLVAQDISDEVSGSYKYNRWPMAAGVNFTVTMSDGTGFGAGGTSDILVTDSSEDDLFYCAFSLLIIFVMF